MYFVTFMSNYFISSSTNIIILYFQFEILVTNYWYKQVTFVYTLHPVTLLEMLILGGFVLDDMVF
jgi:hypothetical protein